jgi:hypothetical protein
MRREIDLELIKVEYKRLSKKTDDNNKTLAAAIRNHTSGDYQKILLALVIPRVILHAKPYEEECMVNVCE